MKCPKCKSSNHHVTDCRDHEDGSKTRRRECLHCKHRWTTKEIHIDEWWPLKELPKQVRLLREKVKLFEKVLRRYE